MTNISSNGISHHQLEMSWDRGLKKGHQRPCQKSKCNHSISGHSNKFDHACNNHRWPQARPKVFRCGHFQGRSMGRPEHWNQWYREITHLMLIYLRLYNARFVIRVQLTVQIRNWLKLGMFSNRCSHLVNTLILLAEIAN